MKEFEPVSYKFCKEYLQNLKYNLKKGVYFSYNLGWYSIELDHSIKSRGWSEIR